MKDYTNGLREKCETNEWMWNKYYSSSYMIYMHNYIFIIYYYRQ